MLLGQGKKKYFVLYPSGECTEPMSKKTAKDYAKMFGGKVNKVLPNKSLKNRPGSPAT